MVYEFKDETLRKDYLYYVVATYGTDKKKIYDTWNTYILHLEKVAKELHERWGGEVSEYIIHFKNIHKMSLKRPFYNWSFDDTLFYCDDTNDYFYCNKDHDSKESWEYEKARCREYWYGRPLYTHYNYLLGGLSDGEKKDIHL